MQVSKSIPLSTYCIMQGRKRLMKNKNKFAFLTLVMTAALLLGACQKPSSSQSVISNPPSNETSDVPSSQISETPSSSEVAPSSVQPSTPASSSTPAQSSQEIPSSSTQPSESSVVSNKCTVTFVVEGQVVYTTEVDEGQIVEYTGDTPTKPADANGSYKFVGWDKDTNSPITADTTFTAVFALFAKEIIIDDFESYEETGDMIDAGWTSLGYNNSTGTWSDQTAATVSLGINSREGEKSLKFEAWENGVGYKFAKTFDANTFKDSANAIQFTLMAPSINSFTVLLNCNSINIAGEEKAPVFKYKPTIQSSEYVTYTIPFNDSGWFLWDKSSSITDACNWAGVADTDFLSWLIGIEFYLQGSDGNTGAPYKAFLDSVKFVTLDNPSYTEIQYNEVFDRYTGTLNSGNILRVDINSDNSAVAKVIDLETPISVNGAVTVNDNIITFTSADNGSTLKYIGRITNGGQLIKFESATGTLATDVEDMNLNGVQVVDNFDQYTEDGKAYYQNNPKEQRSGARGAFYSEYYNEYSTTTSPWGGYKWNLMGGNGDQLKLITNATGAHSGNQYLSLKCSGSNGMRYMQWGLFDGSSEKCSYRGSKMSFWAKTDGVVPKFTAYMYSQNAPTNATRDQYVKKVAFTEGAVAINEWTHFEVELNPNVVYYGFMFFLDANWGADSYLFIDDIEIYTADPYATYVEPEPEKVITVLPGTNYLGQIADGLINAYLYFESNSAVSFFCNALCGYGLEGTYEFGDDREITISIQDGGVIYKATMSEDASELIFKSISGDNTNYADYISALENVNFRIADFAEHAESYENDGLMYYQSNKDESKISGARGAYYCEYSYTGATAPIGGSNWILMGGNGDQVQLEKNYPIFGNQSLKFKKSNNGQMRYIQWDLFKGTAKARTGMDAFVIDIQNTTNTTAKVKVMVFTEQKVTAENFATSYIYEDVQVVSSDIQTIEIRLDPSETYYGYGLWFEKEDTSAGTGFVTVDDAMFYKDMEINCDYYAPKDLVLNGTNGLNASVKFGDYTQAFISYPSLGLNNVECSYRMTYGGGQGIIFSLNNMEIEGHYVCTLDGKATFTVTSVDPTLASFIPVGSVFTNK